MSVAPLEGAHVEDSSERRPSASDNGDSVKVSTLRIVSCACAFNGKRLRRGSLLREVRRLRSGGRHRDRLAGRQHILRPGALVVGPRARGGILFGRGGSPRGHRCLSRFHRLISPYFSSGDPAYNPL